MKNIRRGTRCNEKFLLKIGGKIKRIDVKRFCEKHKLAGLIKISDREYPDMPEHAKLLTHFNLQFCGNRKGSDYLLIRMLRHGHYINDKEEKLPLLSPDGCIIARCMSVKENIPYEKLKRSDFRYSLSNIKNTKQLKKAIVRRYSKSMPELNKEEILALGVSMTKLKLPKKAYNLTYNNPF